MAAPMAAAEPTRNVMCGSWLANAERRYPISPLATAGDLRTRALIEGCRLFALALPDLLVSDIVTGDLPRWKLGK